MTKRNFYVTDKIWARVKSYADSKGLKIADVLRRAIVEFLEREEK